MSRQIWYRQVSTEHLPELDPDSSVPIYLQLRRILRDLIVAGLRPGDRLPPEIWLAEKYGVSRNTVRQAIDSVFHEGLVQRRRGSGTFVSSPKPRAILNSDTGVSRNSIGPSASWTVTLLSIENIRPDERLKARLKVEDDEPLVKIRTLYLCEEDPVCYEASYLTSRVCPNLLEHVILIQ